MNLHEIYSRFLLAAYQDLVRPILFRVGYGDPEAAHEATIDLLAGIPDWLYQVVDQLFNHKSNPVTIAGIDFPGRVGIAAGVDKDGHALRAWSHLGMGFAELGTVTPLAQPGNPKPRMFRLKESQATINRMGFNNEGARALAELLQEAGLGSSGHGKLEPEIDIPIGVSIGKNRTTVLEKAKDDYLSCARVLRDVADYLAINVSSPNTPGLRGLQAAKSLRNITRAVVEEAEGTPVFVKISPDMTDPDFDRIIGSCEDAGVSAIIATNTTTERTGLAPTDQPLATQAGGLSGAPLTKRSLETVEYLASRTELPIVGVGGILTPEDAQNMFNAGASLVQIYTGFIFAGPALAYGINKLTKPLK